MTYIRKKITILLLVSFILLLLPVSNSHAESYIINQTSVKENITSGATLEKIARFTLDGWQIINVLHIDLSNPYIKVDTIANSESLKKLASTKTLAQSKGAVAAVNAGFFNWVKDLEGTWGYPDGPVVESSKIVTASSEYNKYSDSMATFAINNLGQVMYDYWKTDMMLIAPDGSYAHVTQFNKPSRDYTDLTILDSRWGKTSIGASSTYPDLVEMVVDKGKVVEIRQSKPAAQIPSEGYVVVTRSNLGKYLLNTYKAGDSIEMDISTTPDWSKVNMAVTGSSILLKDGRIPSRFSVDTSNNTPNPRTAVGSTRDGKQLFLVTVDGRQAGSTGMTLTQLAQYMQELGAYNAINLDGGGSTTMVERKPGTSSLDVINKPSDGMPRSVATAIGVFSLAPSSSLNGLIIDTSETNVFVNTSRSFTVRGYDKYFNPVEVKPEQVKWSVSGIKGTFTGNTFYPKSVGEGKIKATVGTVSAELSISALSSPVQLTLSDTSLKLPKGQSKSLSISGKNKNGYYASINPADVKWSVSGGTGTVKNGTFTAANGGTGYIDASVGTTHAYCAVSVSSESTAVKDTFEASNASFLSYPSDIAGSYAISAEQKHLGKSSGKLTYDFPAVSKTRAAYAVLSNSGISLDAGAAKLGLWVYNDHINPCWLGAEVQNSKGEKKLLYFTKGMDWTGWKYVELPLDGIDSPAKLDRLYVVLTENSPLADSGTIYMDDLTVKASGGYPAVDASKLPKDTAPKDEANKSVTYKPGSTSFRFSVFGQSHEPVNALQKLLALKLSDKINKYIDAGAFIGSGSHSIAKTVKKPIISTNTGYKSFDIQTSRFIQLDMSKNGLRASNKSQWSWFQQQLDSAAGKNVFIFMANSPKNFTDSLEAGLLQDTLTKYKQKTGKNVWVFYNSDTNASYMERGIKYITTTGYDAEGLTPSNTAPAKYVLVTVKGSTVTFEFKPII